MSQNMRPPQVDHRQVRMSVRAVGVALKGMDQKVEYSAPTMTLLIAAHKNSGVLKLTTTGVSIVGAKFDTHGASTWGEKLDMIAKSLKQNEACYFALFREPLDCLFITYIPDNAKPKVKTIYATNKESAKEGITSLDDNINLEELNAGDVSELSYEKYKGKVEAPKPYSEAELLRKEQDEAEHGGGYGVLARIMDAQKGIHGNRDVIQGDANAKPFALPGLGQLGQVKLKKAEKIKIPATKKSEPTKPQLKPIEKVKVTKAEVKVAVVPEVKKEEVQAPPPPPEEMDDLLAPTATARVSVEKIKREKTESEMQGIESERFAESDLVIIKKGLEEVEEEAVQKEMDEINKFSKEVDDEVKSEIGSLMDKQEVEDTANKDVESLLDEKDAEEEIRKLKEAETKVEEEDEEEEIERIKEELQEDLEDDEETLLAPTGRASSKEIRQPEPAHVPSPTQETNHYMTQNRVSMEEEKPVQQQPQPDLRKVSKPQKSGGFFGMLSNLFRRKKKDKKPKAVMLSPEIIATLDDQDGRCTLRELKEIQQTGDYQDLDPRKLEYYLSSKEFAAHTNMTKESFYQLPQGQQDSIRKDLGLL